MTHFSTNYADNILIGLFIAFAIMSGLIAWLIPGKRTLSDDGSASADSTSHDNRDTL